MIKTDDSCLIAISGEKYYFMIKKNLKIGDKVVSYSPNGRFYGSTTTIEL